MSTIRKLKIEKLIPQLEEVRRISTMETATMGDEIKKEIKCWIYFNIEDPLNHIIKELKTEVYRSKI